jgi:hypothetical protein
LDIDQVPEERLNEFVLSGLLKDLCVLFENILAERGNWRALEIFINNLSVNIKLFNPIELQETLLLKIFELL